VLSSDLSVNNNNMRYLLLIRLPNSIEKSLNFFGDIINSILAHQNLWYFTLWYLRNMTLKQCFILKNKLRLLLYASYQPFH